MWTGDVCMSCFSEPKGDLLPSTMGEVGKGIVECRVFASLQNTESADGLSEQTRWFVQARTNLQVLLDGFAHAPSRDMSPELLRFLMRIMQVSYLCCFETLRPFARSSPSTSIPHSQLTVS